MLEPGDALLSFFPQKKKKRPRRHPVFRLAYLYFHTEEPFTSCSKRSPAAFLIRFSVPSGISSSV